MKDRADRTPANPQTPCPTGSPSCRGFSEGLRPNALGSNPF